MLLSLLLPFFSRSHVQALVFFSEEWVGDVGVSREKKAHELVPQERTYLSLKSMQGIWNMSVSGCLCVFLRIFRHVSDVGVSKNNGIPKMDGL